MNREDIKVLEKNKADNSAFTLVIDKLNTIEKKLDDTSKELLKYTKDYYDRLQEISPIIPRELIEKFKKEFNKPEYANISKPEETNGLEHIVIYGSENPMTPAFNISSPKPIPPAPIDIPVETTS